MTKRYRVLLPASFSGARKYYRLSYPTDPEIVGRIVGGERVPREERGEKEVRAGVIVDDIPSVSLPWLLEQGYVEEVADG